MNSSDARQFGRQQRQALKPSKRALFNRAIQRHVSQLGGQFALYWPLPEEADPRIEGRFYLPVVQDDRLVFRAYAPGVPMIRGELGIMIPERGIERAVEHLDWVGLPLTAFDLSGHRVGMGGGYYDRALVTLPRAKRVGIAFDEQRVSRIEAEPWDLPLGAVITPSGLRRF